MQLGNLPRVRLANLPTPLEEAPRLTEFLGGPRIWIKRDDLTGLALGGNKARKLEFLLGHSGGQADQNDMGAVVLPRRAVIALKRKEPVVRVEQVADALWPSVRGDRRHHEEAAADRGAGRQAEAGRDLVFFEPELRHPGSGGAPLAHQVQHQGQNALGQGSSDSDCQEEHD